MKTQVFQLDPHDDIVSVRDRLGWGRAGRVVLIWPERGNILQRQLDLVLLKRYAQRNGMQIGLVTKDPVVIEHARETDLPVFTDSLHAQQGRWRTTRRRARFSLKKERTDWANRRASLRDYDLPGRAASSVRQPSRLLRAGLFAASVLALLAILASVLPGAAITIQRPQSEQAAKQVLAASYQPKAGQFALQTTTIVVEARSSQPTTGQVKVPEKAASGSVQFTNLTEKEVVIPVGTVVTTLANPVVRFATTRAGKVPAGFGRTALVDVAAVNPGAQGNLPAESLQAIEGTLGLSLTARNLYATHGGSDQVTMGPNQKDRDALLERTLAELETQARKEIFTRWQSNPSSNDFPILPTLQLEEILEQTYSPAKDWASSQLELHLRVSFRADAVAGEQINQLFLTILDSQLEYGQEPVSEAIEITMTRVPVMVGNLREEAERTWQWEMQAIRPTRKMIQAAQVAEMSRLLPAAEASRILQNGLGLQEPPLVEIWPTWWPYMSITSLRIQVTIAP